MKKHHPKNKKRVFSRPLARATEHKLNCRFCGGLQDHNLVNHLFNKQNKKDSSLTRISYACDHCPRSLLIYKSVSGFYLIQSSLDKRKKWAKEFIKQQADGNNSPNT